jgi:hypothetical protein
MAHGYLGGGLPDQPASIPRRDARPFIIPADDEHLDARLSEIVKGLDSFFGHAVLHLGDRDQVELGFVLVKNRAHLMLNVDNPGKGIVVLLLKSVNVVKLLARVEGG